MAWKGTAERWVWRNGLRFVRHGRSLGGEQRFEREIWIMQWPSGVENLGHAWKIVQETVLIFRNLELVRKMLAKREFEHEIRRAVTHIVNWVLQSGKSWWKVVFGMGRVVLENFKRIFCSDWMPFLHLVIVKEMLINRYIIAGFSS